MFEQYIVDCTLKYTYWGSARAKILGCGAGWARESGAGWVLVSCGYQPAGQIAGPKASTKIIASKIDKNMQNSKNIFAKKIKKNS